MKNNISKKDCKDLLVQPEKNKVATNRNNISTQYKKQLMNTNQMVTPPSSVWDRIEKVLDEQNRRKLKTPKKKSQSTKQGKLVNEKQTFYMTSVAS